MGHYDDFTYLAISSGLKPKNIELTDVGDCCDDVIVDDDPL